jgi:hypothetical protein
MKIYRIYTEDLNRQGIVDITGSVFDGFTLLPGVGVWQGKTENCLIVEIVDTEHVGQEVVNKLAACIADLNKQECCLVTVQNVETEFIRP